MSLLELAERVERATGPDRSIDADICELIDLPLCVEPDCLPDVFKKIIDRARSGDERFGPDEDCPLYTASLDAAMTLVPEGWAWMCGCDVDEPFFATLAPTDESGIEADDIEMRAATPALALCAAALRARAALRQLQQAR